MDAQPATEPTQTEKFFRYFQRELTDLNEKISNLSNQNTSGGEHSYAIEHVRSGISKLSTEVRNASVYVPAHDQRIYGEAIKGLQAKLKETQEAFAPRQKFSFKSSDASGSGSGVGVGAGLGGFTAKKNASAISINDAVELAREKGKGGAGVSSSDDGEGEGEGSFGTTPAELVSPAPEAKGAEGGVEKETPDRDRLQQRHPSLPSTQSINLTNHDGTHIILPSSAHRATSAGNLSMLHNCVVDMSRPTSSSSAGHPFASLTLKNIKSSLVLCGRVNGPAHLTNITNSIVVVSSRQFRLHDSKDCDVYLHTSSRPIIENSSGIRFGALPEIYKGDEGVEGVDEQWKEVDDFNWHRSEASPNWSFLPVEERVKGEVWRDVVPGAPGKGSEEILRAVGIAK